MAKRKSKQPTDTSAATPLTDWDRFLQRLPQLVEAGSLLKALTMLRREKFQLFAEVQPEFVSGIVRSQSSDKRLYACRLEFDGSYSCCTQNLIRCVVSHGSPCKHLLVLVLGLVKSGEFRSSTALEWLDAAGAMGLTEFGGKPNKDVVTATFLRYKGVEAGEIDWRPTETIPEDFYSM